MPKFSDMRQSAFRFFNSEDVEMYDLIGDIHGHADELEHLLNTLGYANINGSYRHPERQVIFLGDLIDRGPKIRKVLETVRSMVEEGHALAIMGNHELNALAFHTEDPDRAGTFLRKRDVKNIRQHVRTLLQLNDAELTSTLDWVRTLPLWLDLEGLRAVHACWDDHAIATVSKGIAQHGGISTTFLKSATMKEGVLHSPVDTILKGKELKLPHGLHYEDKDGHIRHEMRTRWYLSPQGRTYQTYVFDAVAPEFDQPLPESVIRAAAPYPTDAKPVFVGHYWLRADQPARLASNVACLDFSVAKGGFLCAYRWNGEQEVSNQNFVWVPSNHSI